MFEGLRGGVVIAVICAGLIIASATFTNLPELAKAGLFCVGGLGMIVTVVSMGGRA